MVCPLLFSLRKQTLDSSVHAIFKEVFPVVCSCLCCAFIATSPPSIQAVLHFQRRLLRCSWSCWRGRAAARLEEQEGLARAGEHYSKQLLLKAFCLWKQKTQERETE